MTNASYSSYDDDFDHARTKPYMSADVAMLCRPLAAASQDQRYGDGPSVSESNTSWDVVTIADEPFDASAARVLVEAPVPVAANDAVESPEGRGDGPALPAGAARPVTPPPLPESHVRIKPTRAAELVRAEHLRPPPMPSFEPSRDRRLLMAALVVLVVQSIVIVALCARQWGGSSVTHAVDSDQTPRSVSDDRPKLITESSLVR
jgi:hypothetical protein